MKSIILATLVVAALTAHISFEKDSHEDSMVGFITKGFFDPELEGEAKIETFLRLANELIPLAQVEADSRSNQGSKLGYTRTYCTGVEGDVFNACFSASAELWIGWYVNQYNATNEINDQVDWQVKYTPFTFLRAGGNVSVSSYPARIGYGAYVSVFDITIPISATIGQGVGLKYSGTFNFAPGTFFTQISTELLECYWLTTPISDKNCNHVVGPTFQHLAYELWQGYNTTFLEG